MPERGDLVWVTLNPVTGHEQAGRRPALVLSPKSYNRKTGLFILCPATRWKKGYAFEVTAVGPDGKETVLLSDHLRNVDWRARKVERMYQFAPDVLEAVIARLTALLIAPDV